MSDDFKQTIKNIFFVFVVLFLTYYSCPYFGEIYIVMLHQSRGTFLDMTAIVGLPLGYIFFVSLLYMVSGGKQKYWWIAGLLIPAALFEVYFDWRHLYFPVGVGLVGWGIGWLIVSTIKVARG